jgi:uncharacterized membrane protein
MLPIPDPLHPAVVHFPIALAVLVPAVAIAALGAIRAGWIPLRTWIAVVVLQSALAGSAWFAIETGEDQEEKVEEVVAERHIKTHEEAAERFLYVAIGVALVSATGLLRGGIGGTGRAVTVAAGLALLAAGVAVGRSGGELVYKYGAARAYTSEIQAAPAAEADLRGSRPRDAGD